MRVLVAGGGIVGLATARALALRGDEVTLVEKERTLALHQSGRNSGVIHSGLYYAPGSLKARLAVAGAASMTAFARERGVPHEVTGKLVVASTALEVTGLHRLAHQGEANGVPVRMLTAAAARDVEPYVDSVAALQVDTTGIMDYPQVCRMLAQDLVAAGGRVLTEVAVRSARTSGTEVRVDTSAGPLRADVLVGCAGLYADRLALACGVDPQVRIVPFRGEYYELAPSRADLVRGLVYPVPDPAFPFLGVHLTRMVGGGVHVGPNAVLAGAREGYAWRDVDVGDLRDSVAWPGLWRLGRRTLRPGARELLRSLSRREFARSVARLLPGTTADDLRPAPAGVRAQALRRDGSLVDDFLIRHARRQVHVLNAPSPAATASLEIAGHLVREVDEVVAGDAAR